LIPKDGNKPINPWFFDGLISKTVAVQTATEPPLQLPLRKLCSCFLKTLSKQWHSGGLCVKLALSELKFIYIDK
jgi:hypothetical protein